MQVKWVLYSTQHTQATTMEDMQASFGANVNELNKTSAVWFDDATYKDLSGQASLTQQENANNTTRTKCCSRRT